MQLSIYDILNTKKINKGYFHSTISMQIFLIGFFKSRQKRTRFGRSGGGFPRRTGRLGAAGVFEAACPGLDAFSPATAFGVMGVVGATLDVSAIDYFELARTTFS